MKTGMRWIGRGVGVLALVAVVVGAMALTPSISFAQAAETATAAVTRTFGLGRHLGFGLFGLGGRGQGDSALADALGISADELSAAREKVFTDSIAQAVADGTITQEEADALLAEHTLRRFLRDRLQTAYSDAINAAVEEGIITQEQADAYLEQGFGRFGDDMGRGMLGKSMMGKGMMGRGMSGHGMMGRMWSDEDGSTGRSMPMTPRGRMAP